MTAIRSCGLFLKISLGGGILSFKIIVMACFLFSSMLVASTLNIETRFSIFDAIKHYQTHHNDYLYSQAIEKKSFLERSVAQDLFKTKLSLSSQFLEFKQSLDLVDEVYNDNTWTHFIELSQQTPWGTEFKVENWEVADQNYSMLGTVSSKWNASVSQSLWKNAFGRSLRFQEQYYNLLYESHQLDRQRQNKNTCLLAAVHYAETYEKHQLYQIYLQVEKSAKDTFSYIQGFYKKKQINHLNYLSAESDFIDIQKKTLEAEKNYLERILVLAEHVSCDIDRSTIFSDPSPYFSSFPEVDNGDFKTTEQWKTFVKKKEALDEKIKKTMDDSRFDLSFDMGFSRSKGKTVYNGELESYGNDQLEFSINLVFPFFESSLDDKIQIARVEKQLVELEADKNLKEWERNYKQAFSDLIRFKKLVQLSIQRESLLKKKQNEAEKRLKSGRMEYEDYVVHRDAYLHERMNLVRYQFQIWKQKIILAQVLDGDSVCFISQRK